MKQVLLSCLKTGGKHAQNLLVNFISVVTAELLAEILDWWLFLVTMGKQVVTPEAAEAAAWSGKTVTFTDLQGLMEEWDAVPKIRARCKELGCLLVEVPPPGTKDVVPTAAISKTVENTRYNQEVLMPVLKRMQKARFCGSMHRGSWFRDQPPFGFLRLQVYGEVCEGSSLVHPIYLWQNEGCNVQRCPPSRSMP